MLIVSAVALTPVATAKAETGPLWYDQFGAAGYADTIAVDRFGNLAVAGGSHLRVYDPARTIRWESETAGWIAATEVDRKGNVLVAGGRDNKAWIGKYGPSGSLLWARELAVEVKRAAASATALSVDQLGNVVVAGTARGIVQADVPVLDAPLPENLPKSSIWIARYDAGGTLLWVRQGAPVPREKIHALAMDGAGNAILVGSSPQAPSPVPRWEGALIIKMDAAGNELWRRGLGNQHTEATGVAIGANGEIFVCGNTTGSIYGYRTDPDADVFVARYSADGVLVWARQLLEEGSQFATGLVGPSGKPTQLLTLLGWTSIAGDRLNWLNWIGVRGALGRRSIIDFARDGFDGDRVVAAIAKGPGGPLYLSGSTSAPPASMREAWVASARMGN